MNLQWSGGIINALIYVLTAQKGVSMFKEQLLNAFLQGNSLSALTESAGILLGAPVMVVDEAFRIAASFAARGGEYE